MIGLIYLMLKHKKKSSAIGRLKIKNRIMRQKYGFRGYRSIANDLSLRESRLREKGVTSFPYGRTPA